jgi:uncharacterized membrane protein YiaA
MNQNLQKPTAAFIGASWAALLVGVSAYLIGLYNLSLGLTLKGYFLVLLLYGLFATVSLQKSVRDQLEEIQVSTLYLGLCWASVAIVVGLLAIGLWNTDGLADSERGFYAMSFLLSLFAVVAVQKNTRDVLLADKQSDMP